MNVNDKATVDYWQRRWGDSGISSAVDPMRPGWANHVHRSMDAYFRRALIGTTHRRKRLLELGCAQSAWLPYFDIELGYEVTGLDYSAVGCAQSQAVLDAAGVVGSVVHGDMFSPPNDLIGAFDVVVSFGLIEHFDDTVGAMRAASVFLAPGGTIFTLVPNMAGIPGMLQRVVDRDVYEIHEVVDPPRLRAAHEAAGLDVEHCDYLMLANWYVVNGMALQNRAARLLFRAGVMVASRVAFQVERIRTDLSWANRTTSPYVVCCAKRPQFVE